MRYFLKSSTWDSPHALLEEVSRIVDSQSKVVTLDFSECKSIGAGATVLIGGLYHYLKSKDRTLKIDLGSMSPALNTKIRRVGLYQVFNITSKKELTLNQRRFAHFQPGMDESQLIERLVQMIVSDWIGDKANSLPMETGDLVGKLWELFHNVFDHSQSPLGAFCSCEYLPVGNMLRFVVADYGKGIPANVRKYLGREDIDSLIGLLVAFERGFTTRERSVGGKNLGGVGLKLLREFVVKYNCRMDVFSESAIARILPNESAVKYEKIPFNFLGTMVVLTVYLK
jgi:hypothetical protein